MPKPKKPEGDGKPAGAAGLTYRQRLFVAHYLGASAGNATDAARRAGYSNAEIGRQLLRNITIRAAIDAKLAGAAMAADEVLARLSDIASLDLADFVTVGKEGPEVDLAKARRRGKLHLIKGLRATRHGPAIELLDALAALQLLGKYHGLFAEKPPAPPEDARPKRIVIPGRGPAGDGDG